MSDVQYHPHDFTGLSSSDPSLYHLIFYRQTISDMMIDIAYHYLTLKGAFM